MEPENPPEPTQTPDEPKPSDDVALEPKLAQQRLRDVIFDENERLRRLIYNLYLNLRLDYLSEQQLFDDICRNVSQYFRASSCALYTVDFRTVGSTEEKESGTRAGSGTSDVVVPHYELRGTFGPYDRALRPTSVLRKPEVHYPLTYPEPDIADSDRAGLGLTEYSLFDDIPSFYPSRCTYRHRTSSGASKVDPENTVGQLVWYQDNLANTSRNILFAPVFVFEDGGECPNGRCRRADAVLKIENRTPPMMPAYGTAGPQHGLKSMWHLAALRPYLRDVLAKPAGKFKPQDHENWIHHYNDHRRGREYCLLIGPEVVKNHGAAKEHLGPLFTAIGKLVDFVTEAEALLQHFGYARYLLRWVQREESESFQSTAGPSLFNINNLTLAWKARPSKSPASDLRSERPAANSVFGRLWSALETLEFKVLCERVESEVFETHPTPASLAETVKSMMSGHSVSHPLPLNIKAGADYLVSQIQRVVDQVLQPDISLHEEFPSVMAEEKVVLRICKKLQIALRKGSESGTTESRALEVLAQQSAAAAMDSHTFSETDVLKLMFVANHVGHLLHSHILQHARRIKVDASSEELSSLRLTFFGLERLKEIEWVWQDIMAGLAYEVGRELAADGLTGFDLSTHEFLLKDFLRSISPAEVKDDMSKVTLTELSVQFTGRMAADNAARAQRTLTRETPKPGLVCRLTRLCDRLETAANKSISEPPTDRMSSLVIGERQETSSYSLVVELNWKLVKQFDPLWMVELLATFRTMLYVIEGKDPAVLPIASPTAQQDRDDSAQQLRRDTTNGDVSVARGELPTLTREIRQLRIADRHLRAQIREQADTERPVDLFRQIRPVLNSYCQAIANVVRADSCAIFFVQDSETADSWQEMAMCGASGRLVEPLNAGITVSYPSIDKLKRDQYRSLLVPGPTQEKHRQNQARRILADWEATQQIWYLADGRIANGRDAMAALSRRRQTERTGKTDQLVYPGDNASRTGQPSTQNPTLANVFRCFLGIPIFARGGRWDPLPLLEEAEKDTLQLNAARMRNEFLQRYRVVGILKVEGKKPQRDSSDLPTLEELKYLIKEMGCEPLCASLLDWLGEVPSQQKWEELLQLFSENAKDGVPFLLEGDLVNAPVVDLLTRLFEAEFTTKDSELLVTIAMQLGRMI